MSHPLQRRPRTHRRLALICVALLAFAPVVVGSVVKSLHEDEPGGRSIVDFEFAGSVKEADEILATWREEGVIDEAKAIQTFDLIYPLIYAVALAGACIAAAGAWGGAGRPSMARAGIVVAWIAFAAAGFDYVENLGLGISLWDEPASPWPEVAAAAAVLKFACIFIALAYALSGILARFLPARPLGSAGNV